MEEHFAVFCENFSSETISFISDTISNYMVPDKQQTTFDVSQFFIPLSTDACKYVATPEQSMASSR